MYHFNSATTALAAGKVIAYPTEAMYGLGCCPFNPEAVKKLKTLKNRPTSKGLILIAANWSQIEDLIDLPFDTISDDVKNSWPGPCTWLFPATAKVPDDVMAENQKIALRITAHPVANALCEAYGGPIVSTSANLSGEAPITDKASLLSHFGNQLGAIVDGEIGTAKSATPIFDALSGEQIR